MPADPAPAGTESKPAKTPRSPWFKGFIEGVLASAVVAVAAYFLTPSGNPRLMFKVSPSRSVVVAKSQVGGLRVLHGDRPIEGDVTAVQVSLWNDGRGPVRGETVLEPIKIVTDPPTQIIVANVQKMTRPLTEVSIDTSELGSGIVPVGFRILERGDGALIQLVYAGPTTVGIRAIGAVEGQRDIETLATTAPAAPRKRFSWQLLAVPFILLVILGRGLEEYSDAKRVRAKHPLRKAFGAAGRLLLLLVALMGAAVVIGTGILFALTAVSPPPPFPL